MTDKQTLLILEGTLFWTKVNDTTAQVNDRGEKEYTVDITIDNKDTLAMLKEHGVTVRNRDAELKAENRQLQGNFVRAKSRFKPIVVDSQLKLMPDSVLIGNGTKGIVKATVYTYKPRKKEQSGVGLGLQAIQVVNLVKYDRTSLSGLEPIEGYTQEATEDKLGNSDEEVSSDIGNNSEDFE